MTFTFEPNSHQVVRFTLDELLDEPWRGFGGRLVLEGERALSARQLHAQRSPWP